MTELPEKFTSRMRTLLGGEYDAFISCYNNPPVRGLRVNTLRIDAESFLDISPWRLEPTHILDEGFIVHGADNVGRHPYHVAGLFYMQEPSAMSAVAASHADGSGLRVLDLCAAPGGKTGGVAAKMRGRGILVANEIVPKRARLLAQNMERLGVTNASVINAHPEAIASALPRFFDIVMVDAPCSGEGMFRKDVGAIAEWSPEHVKACAERQSLILESAAECVRGGGCIVYSTCTFSEEENEGVIESFLNRHDDFSVEFSERLYPHTSCGEGHFVCRMRRDGNSFEARAGIPPLKDKATLRLLNDFMSDMLENGLPDGIIHMAGGKIRLIPHDMPAEVLKLHPVTCGIELGEPRKGRFEPSHTFFMAALEGFSREVGFPSDSSELFRFLSGNTVPCPNELRGYCRVTVNTEHGAFPIGFGKAVDGTLKNHIPKGLYIN